MTDLSSIDIDVRFGHYFHIAGQYWCICATCKHNGEEWQSFAILEPHEYEDDDIVFHLEAILYDSLLEKIKLEDI